MNSYAYIFLILLVFLFQNCKPKKVNTLLDYKEYQYILDHQYSDNDIENLEKNKIKINKIGVNENGVLWMDLNYFNENSKIYLNEVETIKKLSNKGLTCKLPDSTYFKNPFNIQVIDEFLKIKSKKYSVKILPKNKVIFLN